MATSRRHAADAASFVAMSEDVLHQSLAIGGEILWGATIQAAQATIQQNNNLHHAQSRNAVTQAISVSRAPKAAKPRMRRAALAAAETLHGGFYQPASINPQEHAKAVAETRLLIERLLHYSRHPAS